MDKTSIKNKFNKLINSSDDKCFVFWVPQKNQFVARVLLANERNQIVTFDNGSNFWAYFSVEFMGHDFFLIWSKYHFVINWSWYQWVSCLLLFCVNDYSSPSTIDLLCCHILCGVCSRRGQRKQKEEKCFFISTWIIMYHEEIIVLFNTIFHRIKGPKATQGRWLLNEILVKAEIE